MPICQNGNVWQEYMHFDKILSKHSQGGTGKAGGGAQHPHHPHPHAGRIPEGWGWCSRVVLPLGAAQSARCTAGQGPKGSAFSLPAHQAGGKSLKGDLELTAGARRLRQLKATSTQVSLFQQN